MSLDQRAFDAINGAWTHPALDWLAALVRATEIWMFPVVIVLSIAAIRGTPRARAVVALCVFVFLVGDFTVVRLGKIAFGRPRPEVVQEVRSVRLAKASPRVLALGMPLDVRTVGPKKNARLYRSFPSGHTWSAFGVATILFLGWRRWGWIAYLAAAAVGYARIVAGLHWPSDIVISAVLSVPLALGIAALSRSAAERLMRVHAHAFPPMPWRPDR